MYIKMNTWMKTKQNKNKTKHVLSNIYNTCFVLFNERVYFFMHLYILDNTFYFIYLMCLFRIE